ncbi:MAG: hypothetical protein ACLFVO_10445 [Chloroflexaceae bacterium]
MQRIVTIVEGDGDVQAVPILLSRLLNYYGWSVNWYVSRPIRVGNLGNLKKNLNRFLDLAAQTSRSFRRLVHALEELTATLDSVQVGLVTPLKSGVE